jgi:hypothetical protein
MAGRKAREIADNSWKLTQGVKGTVHVTDAAVEHASANGSTMVLDTRTTTTPVKSAGERNPAPLAHADPCLLCLTAAGTLKSASHHCMPHAPFKLSISLLSGLARRS